MVIGNIDDVVFGEDATENIALLSNLFGRASVIDGDPYQNVYKGGGNTSVHLGKYFYVKPSGKELGTITAEEFCKIDVKKIMAGKQGMDELCDSVLTEDYRDDFTPVKLLDEMFSKLSIAANMDSKDKPSCEARLHAQLAGTPDRPRYNVHDHNSLVNGWLCSNNVKGAYKEMFGDDPDVLLMPEFVETGAPLSMVFEEKVKEWNGHIVCMAQHGKIQTGYSPKEVWDLHLKVVNKVKEYAEKNMPKHTFGVEHVDYNQNAAFRKLDAIEYLEKVFDGKKAYAFDNDELLKKMLHSKKALETIAQGAPNPDAQVYGGAAPMVVDYELCQSDEDLYTAIDQAKADYIERFKNLNLDGSEYLPKTVLIPGVCAITLGDIGDDPDITEKQANNAYAALMDTVNVMKWAEPFGGMKPLSDKHLYYVNNWALEGRRRKLAEKG